MRKTLFPGYSVGPDAYEDVQSVCKQYGKKVAVVGGKRALEAAQDKILKELEKADMEVVGVFWYGGEASVENIEMLTPKVQGADMIFAVGGGKAIDTGKVLAHNLELPFFTFPTIASTCASCTSIAALYHPDGSLREYSFSKIPPNHIFIDTEVIANAPAVYFWAGMGDTMAKHYESTISSRNDNPEFTDAMGVTLSPMCAKPLLLYGEKALEDCKNHVVSKEFTEVVLSIIVATGFVSNFVQVGYTSGLAHAVYNGFTVLPTMKVHHHLHGEIVAYGVLVMLTVDKQYETRDKLFDFCKKVGFPTCIKDLDVKEEELPVAAQKALQGIDLKVYPYEVSAKMIVDGILELEEYQK